MEHGNFKMAMVVELFVILIVVVVVIVRVVIVVMIIGVVVVVMIIRVVVVVGVSAIIKLFPCDPVGLIHPNRLGVCIPPGQGVIVACASRAAAIPSTISCRMAAYVIVGVSDVDVLLGGIYKTT
ncbi:hypothetical protein Tco_0971805 [Tanacetum coccineum]